MTSPSSSGGAGGDSGSESGSEIVAALLEDIGLALHDAVNACSCGREDALMNLSDSLDVDNLVASAAGIAGEILTCQSADSQGYLRGALGLTTQLGSGLGQMGHQGQPLVPEAAHAQFAGAVGGEVIESAGSRQQTIAGSRQQQTAAGGLQRTAGNRHQQAAGSAGCRSSYS